MRHYLCLISLLFSSLFVKGQWSLQQCIDRALQYNIQIKQSSLGNQLNKIQVDQNLARMFPSLNGSTSLDYFFGRSIDPYTNIYTNQQVRSNSFNLNSTLTLFEGLSLQNALKESKLTYLSSQHDLMKIQNDISISVVNNYLLVLYNDELSKTTKEQMEASVIQRNRSKRMYELGSVNKGAYLDLESQLATDELKYIQAQTQYDQSLLALTQLLELDTVKNFSVSKPEIVVPAFDSGATNIERVFASALTTQPEIKSAEYKELSAEKALKVAKGGYYPRLYISGSLNTSVSSSSKDITLIEQPPRIVPSGYTSTGDTVFSVIPVTTPVFTNRSFSNQFNDNLGKTVGFTLQVPIFNGLTTRSNVKRSEINLQQTHLENELTRKTLFKSVQQAVADALASYKKYNASERSVAALEENYNFNKQRFDLGLISTYDYLLSKNNLATAQANLLQAKYDYIFRLKIIDFYLGKPLSF